MDKPYYNTCLLLIVTVCPKSSTFLSIRNMYGWICVTPCGTHPHVTDKCKDKLEKHQRYCTRLTLNDEDDYESRLSILKIDELNVHLQMLGVRFMVKDLSYDDHPCTPFLTKDHHSYDRPIILDDNIFNKLTWYIRVFVVAWSYMSLWLDRQMK